MVKHLMILDIIFLLFIGLWAAFNLKNLYRRHYYPYLKHIFEYVFFLNLLIFWWLIIFYSILNLPANYFRDRYPLLLEFNEYALIMIQFGVVASVYRVWLSFREKKTSPAQRGILYGFAAVIAISYVVKLAIPSRSVFFRIIDSSQFFIFDNLLALDAAVLILIFVYGRKSAEKSRKRLMESFSLLSLSKYVSLPLLLMFFKLMPSLARPMRLLIASALLFWMNFIPFAWMKWFFLKHVSLLKLAGNQTVNLDHFCEAYGLSRREREILELLLKGKSNRDVEDLLFISYHTVKNHVSNIYGKLGIKNRNDLANLISGFPRK